ASRSARCRSGSGATSPTTSGSSRRRRRRLRRRPTEMRRRYNQNGGLASGQTPISRGSGMNKRTLLAAFAVTVFTAACTTTTPQVGADPASKRSEIDAKVDGALTKLYAQARGSQEMVRQAKGVLVF